MVELGKNAKININWIVSPFDYSKETKNKVAASAAKKYKIPKEHVKVTPVFVTHDKNGKKVDLTNDITQNIQDPSFQVKLFKNYISYNNIEDCDFDFIKKIDAQINEKIDYQSFDKFRRFSVKWIKWDNFLSYGTNNVFDFRNLNGLILLDGQNQSGKSTFSIDLIHFLLFGKTTKVATQDKIFNKHLDEATNVVVEGCLEIEGDDYIIKRTLTRPSLARRSAKSKTQQKVEYYRIVGSDRQELVDYVDNQQEENSVQTNKKIKEAIGREDDFDLAMSITESNLDDLIDKKDSERGRLLSRWIGLMPLETKDTLAREEFNQHVKPYLLSNQYSTDVLKKEIGAYNSSIEQNKRLIAEYQNKNNELDEDIRKFEEIRNSLLLSKQNIDESIMKLDIDTLERSIDNDTEKGKSKKYELESIEKEIAEIGDIDFSNTEYDKLSSLLNTMYGERAKYAEQYKSLTSNIEHLKKSEYCPTCGRKLEGVDNSKKIAELTEEVKSITESGKKVADMIKESSAKLDSMKENREKYNRKNMLLMKKSALEMNIEKLRNDLRDLLLKKKQYQMNSEAIDKNNKLDIQIRNNDVIISDRRKSKENNIAWINQNTTKINEFNDRIKEREDLIDKINNEEKLLKNWKIYLDMVGKNGISKMVLRETLPIINARLSQMLSNVCDFDVEVVIDDKNNVGFNLIKDGVVSDLSSGSGFEKTCASLALRFVLADISTIPKSDSVMLDEVWGRVTKENLDGIHSLINTALKNYRYMFVVAHIDEVKNWCNTIVTVKKENNVSSVKLSKIKN